MAFTPVKRVEVSGETLDKALVAFETPKEFYKQARLMITNEELVLLAAMGVETHSLSGLVKIVEENNLADDAEGFIDNAWRRVIIDKTKDAQTNEIKYKAANFYNRFPVFAQYEPELYSTIPKYIMDAMSDWEYEIFLSLNRKGVLHRMKSVGPDEKMRQSDFLALDEALQAIDECENELRVVPCDCKAMTYYHHKPTDVCIDFGLRQSDLNSQRSRGYGSILSKEDAKELVRECSKAGLMHCGDISGFCNCDSPSCFPLRMAMELESRLIYPRAHYKIDYDRSKCDDCGICTRVCNFNAFSFTAYREVRYDPDKCYGCTICAANCPKKAIRLEKI